MHQTGNLKKKLLQHKSSLSILAVVILICTVQIIILLNGDFQTYQIPVEDYLKVADKSKEYRVEGIVKEGSVLNESHSFEVCSNQNCIRAIYDAPWPQNFGEDTSVIIAGKWEQDIFKVRQLLVRCPSKYSNDPEAKHPASIPRTRYGQHSQ